MTQNPPSARAGARVPCGPGDRAGPPTLPSHQIRAPAPRAFARLAARAATPGLALLRSQAQPGLATLALLASLAATPALALSCSRPTIAEAYAVARDATEAYVPVLGRFSIIPARSEKTDAPQSRRYVAQFTGVALTRRGEDIPLSGPVEITEICISAWCPTLRPGLPALTFLRVERDRYTLSVNACAGNVFPQPSAQMIATLRRCLQNATC